MKLFYLHLQPLCLYLWMLLNFLLSSVLTGEKVLALFHTTAAWVFMFVSITPFKYLLLCVVFPHYRQITAFSLFLVQ